VPTQRGPAPRPSPRRQGSQHLDEGNACRHDDDHPASAAPRARLGGYRPSGVNSTPTIGITGPRPGFRRVVGVVKTPTKEAPLGPDDGRPTRAARRTCASTALNPDARRPSTGRLAPTPTPTPTRLRGRAYARAGRTRSVSCPPLKPTRAWPDGRDRRRRTATSPKSGLGGAPPKAPAAWAVAPARARKRPRSPNRVSPSSELTGTVQISRWRYVAYFCSQWAISHE